MLRYQHHYFMATGVHGKGVADVFKEHADEEREHTDELAERIQQLGGKPNFNPGDLVARSVSQYIEGESLADMIREDLIAERIVIDVYREMIKYFGDKDPTTRLMIEHILQDEEEHASDLSDLLYVVNPSTGETEVQDPGTEIGQNSREQSMDEKASGKNQSQTVMRQENKKARQGANADAKEAREVIGNIANQRKQGRQTEQVTDARRPQGNREEERSGVGQSGTNRSSKIVDKNRKNKRAA